MTQNSVVTAQAAVDHLVLTRERLRRALKGPTASHGTGGSTTGLTSMAWIGALMAKPGIALLSRTLTALVQPMAHRHPLAFAAGSMAVGGALAWSRPWRWHLTQYVIAGLVPRLIPVLLGGAREWLAMAGRASAAPPGQPHAGQE